MAKKPLYSQTPAVSKKAIAGTNPVGTVELGSATSPTVPKKPSTIHGLDVPAHTFRGASIKGARTYGRIAKITQSKGHRVGLPKPKKVP